MAVSSANLQEAHELLDQLPAEKLEVVHDLLVVLADAPSYTIDDAPVDTAELTPETRAAIDESRAALSRGEGIPHDEVRREFGLLK